MYQDVLVILEKRSTRRAEHNSLATIEVQSEDRLLKEKIQAYRKNLIRLPEKATSAFWNSPKVVEVRKEIEESQEKGTSYFGERVTVRTVKEDITHNPDGSINLDAEYVLVGDSGKEYDTVTLRFREAKTRLPMPEFFKVLLQLSRSGVHATKVDIRRFFGVGGSQTAAQPAPLHRAAAGSLPPASSGYGMTL